MSVHDEGKIESAGNLTSAGAFPESEEFNNRFSLQQARILYGNATVGLAGTILCATVLVYFFLGNANSSFLLGWFGILLIVSLLRFALVIAYRYTHPEQHNRQWLFLFDAGTAISGMVWGVTPWLLLPGVDFVYYAILCVVVGGLSAGTVAMYSVSRRGSILFILTSNIPVLISLHLLGTEIATGLEILGAFLMLAMLATSNKLYAIACRYIRLGMQNRGLVDYLRTAKNETDQLNERLKAEIETRKGAEQAAIENEKRFKNLSDASFEGILIHENGRILDANHAAAEMTGYAPQQMVGMNVLQFTAPEYHEILRARLAQPSEKPLELSAVKANGERFPVQLSARDFPYHGRMVRVVAVRDLSRTAKVEKSLQISEQRLARYMQQTLIAIVELTPDMNVSEWNPAAERIFGYRYDEAIGHNIQDLIIPAEYRHKASKVWHRVIAERQPMTFTYTNITSKGEQIVCDWDITPVVDSDNNVTVVIALAHDITERVHAQEALLHEKELAEVTLASLGDGVITMNRDGTIKYINPVAESLTFWTMEDAHGRDINEVFMLHDEDTGERCQDLVRQAMQHRGYEFGTRRVVLQRQDRERIPVVLTGSPMKNYRNEIIGAVLVFRDVSELRVLEARLSYEATHDSLTGLINRREFEKRVANAIVTADEQKCNHVLIYLDLDQFKVVNDTCGHLAGDELLKQLANRLSNDVRDSDAFARLGGDEFGLLLENCPIEKAELIAENLRLNITQYRFAWDDKTFEIGASIGVVPIVGGSGTLEDLLRAADSACYVAKEDGRNRVHVYDAEDRAVERRHGEMQWVSRIKRAIEDDRIVLYVQMIRPIHEGIGDIHYEILMRMQDEQGNLIPPMAYIPAAERYDMMVQLDKHVIRKACGLLKEFSSEPSRPSAKFSINLSGQSLSDDDFLDIVVEELNRSEVEEGMVCFEITETAAIGNMNRARRFMSILHGMGCLFSLDDFGSGLSSFGYLKNMNVDYLKIDGGFIRELCDDPVNESMVRSINEVGHVLGMKTIAEFVENEAILAHLKEIGVDYVQGYFIEKPHPFEDLLR